jgi:hypothetical protein
MNEPKRGSFTSLPIPVFRIVDVHNSTEGFAFSDGKSSAAKAKEHFPLIRAIIK